MVAAICSSQLQTLGALYQNNKTFRYSIYALEALAIAGLRQNTRQVSIAILGVSVLFLGQKIFTDYPHLRDIYTRNTSLDIVEQAALVSQLTQSLFVVMLICGITLNGWNLSCVWEEGKCLVQGVRDKDLFACLSAVNSLGNLGTMWGPLAFLLIHQEDEFFHSTLGKSTSSFIANFLKAYQKNRHNDFLKSYIEKLKPQTNHLPHSIAHEITSFACSFPGMQLSDYLKIMLILRRLDIGSPKVTRSKNPTLLQQVQTMVNSSLFYGFAFSMLWVRLYYYPIPTTAAFLCGLFYPTQMESRKDLEHRWERVPDFISLPLRKKFEYIFNRTNLTLGGLRFGYPAAFLKGLFLAEEFRYYIWPHVKSWCPLPIEPFIPRMTDNRWQTFLGNEFEKITSVEFDSSDYQEFKRKLLRGSSPRKLLALEKEHTVEDIQIAYKRYALHLHPDISANIHRREEATVLFKCLQKASIELRDLLKAPEEPVLEASTKEPPPYDFKSDPTSQFD
jgi:hypothetical protein